MIPEFGLIALVIACCMSFAQFIFPLTANIFHDEKWYKIAKPAAIFQVVFLLISYLCLTFAFLSNDFSVRYVALHSNTHLPWIYQVSAVWGAHEGSMLLWATLLGLWTFTVTLFASNLSTQEKAKMIAILGFISTGFLLFILTTSNPFLRLLTEIPKEGLDLNPLLQDPGLAIHPPMLYMGYVGFAIVFSLAMTSLLTGKLNATWARYMRLWTLIAWCFLTLGITFGSLWSYRELGWGGFWAWDPVENASLLPWLVGTALLHSLIVSEKRDTFNGWTILLAILAFALSLLGTFLVRSGILTSIHAFALDPTRGLYMLVYLVVIVGLSLFLFACFNHKIKSNGQFDFFSRETFLLSNNMILIVMMATILLGTLYPLIIDALHLGKLSVGAPYFNLIMVPLTLPLLILMGIAPLVHWKKMTITMWYKNNRTLLIYFFTFIVILTIIMIILPKRKHILSFLGICASFWLLLSTLHSVYKKSKQLTFQSIPLRFWGMVLAHSGIAILVLGISISSSFSIEKNIRMNIGEKTQLGPFELIFKNINEITGPNYKGMSTLFFVNDQKRFISTIHAEKRLYTTQNIVMTEPGILLKSWYDLYIALGSPFDDGSWSLRLYFKPLIRFIWLGGFLMFFGGFLAGLDRWRKRCNTN